MEWERLDENIRNYSAPIRVDSEPIRKPDRNRHFFHSDRIDGYTVDGTEQERSWAVAN